MYQSMVTTTDLGQRMAIHRCDRWSIHRRLQELNIASTCPADGSLWVEVNDVLDLVLVWSTIRQFIVHRQETVDWLERCWTTQVTYPGDQE